MTKLAISEARKELNHLPKRLEKEHDAIGITQNGKTVMAIMDWELYESIVETMEVLSDATLMTAIKKGAAEYKAGKFKTLDQVRKELLP